MTAVGGDSKEAVSLNIMPMLDIFSILVIFLLMSYSTDPVIHDLHQGVELPKSDTITSLDEIPVLAVTKTKILINEKEIADIVNGDVPLTQRDQGAVRPVYDELVRMKKSSDRLQKARGKKEKLGVLTMEMDKKHNFKLMKRIMLAAQQAEFLTFKLAVNKRSR